MYHKFVIQLRKFFSAFLFIIFIVIFWRYFTFKTNRFLLRKYFRILGKSPRRESYLNDYFNMSFFSNKFSYTQWSGKHQWLVSSIGSTLSQLTVATRRCIDSPNVQNMFGDIVSHKVINQYRVRSYFYARDGACE